MTDFTHHHAPKGLARYLLDCDPSALPSAQAVVMVQGLRTLDELRSVVVLDDRPDVLAAVARRLLVVQC